MTKIVYVYIVYLDAWPRNSTNNFNFRNCLFGVNKLVKNSDKEKYVHSGYGIITFNNASSWRFSNDFAKNVIICDVDNSLSSHSENCKNNFLLLDEVPTQVLMEALDYQKQSLVLILLKQTQSFEFT